MTIHEDRYFILIVCLLPVILTLLLLPFSVDVSLIVSSILVLTTYLITIRFHKNNELSKQQKKKKPLVYILVGLISAGKSTTGFNTSQSFNSSKNRKVKFVPEPVEIWEKSGMLALFYKSFAKAIGKDTIFEPLLFQMTAFSTRVVAIKKAFISDPDADAFILDSFMTVDRDVFTRMLIDSGRIPQDQLPFYDLVYQNWHDIVMPELEITRYIFLDVDPSNCLVRKETRDRESEKTSVSLEYLQELNRYFKKFINKDGIYEKLITINANGNQENVAMQIRDIIEKDLLNRA
jgi:deoxyadenosine/deoxycytidine kinase